MDFELKIKSKTFINHKSLTICILELNTGFFITGTSSPIFESDYEQALGEDIAYDNALKELQKFQAYQRKQSMFEAAQSVPVSEQ